MRDALLDVLKAGDLLQLSINHSGKGECSVLLSRKAGNLLFCWE